MFFRDLSAFHLLLLKMNEILKNLMQSTNLLLKHHEICKHIVRHGVKSGTVRPPNKTNTYNSHKLFLHQQKNKV